MNPGTCAVVERRRLGPQRGSVGVGFIGAGILLIALTHSHAN